jgi:hypothetical protein
VRTSTERLRLPHPDPVFLGSLPLSWAGAASRAKPTDGMNEAMLCGSMTYDKINFVDGLSCRELSIALH